MFESYCRQNDIDGKEIKATISGKPVTLKVASTNDSKLKGFMNSEGPGDNDGIIFIYEDEDYLRFWMKDVGYPLDILFFDTEMNLVDNLTMEQDDSETPEIHTSARPARFAVELKAGWAKANNIDSKSKLKF